MGLIVNPVAYPTVILFEPELNWFVQMMGSSFGDTGEPQWILRVRDSTVIDKLESWWI